ncbi:LacI family DNA-binding transcriptional regulator [Alloacidobacterium dinghuense]|uniref:LacI family DNA-binding transcriptional regulator n=1 Tax=Alloacidobacterium dinghuense TaxID=2763107 RepID=A0A7G8BIH1_9BACT|nr:LacI family DNA-binding transcriptional regulator [Alloacidobacterium dinghuense]QNI32341.1 LacI family DNA-binding transcriptional regulator [Alloacidobacterium dinghuense]
MNIKEVAKLAKVSTATVSRTINGSDKVTPETAERVRRAIETLKFYPNTYARALGSGRSSLYGLIISDLTNPFFPELVKSFEEIAVQHGQEVLIANTNYDPHRMEVCVSRMLQRKVDGVAIMTSEMTEHLVEELAVRRIPLAFLDTAIPQKGVSNILVDYAVGIDAAVEHLTSLGHRAISFIAGPVSLTSARIRKRAFIHCLERNRIKLDPHFMEEGNHRTDGGYEAMCRLLDLKVRPTAVLTSNDMTAIGAMVAISERGLEIPKDISIIGFDDIELSSFTKPPLTTVRLSRQEIAKMAFRALYNTYQSGAAKGAQYPIETSLIVRQSTGPKPATKR